MVARGVIELCLQVEARLIFYIVVEMFDEFRIHTASFTRAGANPDVKKRMTV